MRGGFYLPSRLVRLWRLLSTSREGGFTVIEVMIVLAVSALLFVSAVVMIAGRQQQTAFDQSIRQIQSQIQQALNEVSAGYYPDKGAIRCSAGPSGPILTNVATGQGTNSGCIFLGKAIQFGVGSPQNNKFVVYTLAGLQRGGPGGKESASLSEAKPMVLAPSTLHSAGSYPDNSLEDALQNGLSVVRMWYREGGSDTDIGTLAFVNSLASYSSTGNIVSGAGSVNVVAVTTTALADSKIDAADAMNADYDNKIADGVLNPSDGVFICFEGGTDDYAIVRVGGGDRELSITLVTKDKGGSTCTYP